MPMQRYWECEREPLWSQMQNHQEPVGVHHQDLRGTPYAARRGG